MHRILPTACVLISSLLVACAPEGAGSVFVSKTVVSDESCVAQASSESFLPTGTFDLSAGSVTGCRSSYDVWLLVNSYLRQNGDEALGRSEPNVLMINSAEVELTTIRDETILFSDADPPLPNPFLVVSNSTIFPGMSGGEASEGVANVDVIPAAYAPFLFDFDGSLIKAKIQLFGTTTGDLDIEVAPFTYPIEICDGCRVRCRKRDVKEGMESTVDQLNMGQCPSKGGVDSVYCIDDDC